MMYVQIFAGFVLLLAGAEVMVRGAVAVARRLGISNLVIGMTVVAFGTSAPELVVSLDAALSGAPAMTLGNLVGSNIANVLLVLGVAGLLAPIAVERRGFTHDSAMLLAGSVLFAAFCVLGVIGLASGLALLAAFFLFLAYTYWRATGGRDSVAEKVAEEVAAQQETSGGLWLGWLMFAGGLAAIIYGADILVDGGVAAARAAGVSEEVIGLTLIAFGTSLPELAASAVAAYRGHADVALGNVLGSNLFNVLGVAGTVAVVTPLPVPQQIVAFDLWVMLAATVVLIPALKSGWRLDRAEAGAFLLAYATYIGVQAYGVSALLPIAG